MLHNYEACLLLLLHDHYTGDHKQITEEDKSKRRWNKQAWYAETEDEAGVEEVDVCARPGNPEGEEEVAGGGEGAEKDVEDHGGPMHLLHAGHARTAALMLSCSPLLEKLARDTFSL